MKIIKNTIYIIALLSVACNPTYTLQSHSNEVIEVASRVDSSILTIITPYQEKIEDKMNEVLSYTKSDLKKGKPQSTIGNFVTDLCLNYTTAHLCVMNNGGLRTTISKGDITREKLYELMPFDNELVVLELEESDFIGLLNYITSRGGEPFSGINITIDKNGKMLNHTCPVNFEKGERVRVLTSDYLANGGDKMWFFKNKNQTKIGIKLRDAIIEICSNTDTINVQLDIRITTVENE